MGVCVFGFGDCSQKEMSVAKAITNIMISVTQENLQNCTSSSSNNLNITTNVPGCEIYITNSTFEQTILSNTQCFLQTLQDSEIQTAITNAILQMTKEMKSGLSSIFGNAQDSDKKVMIKNALNVTVKQINKQDVKNAANNIINEACNAVNGKIVIDNVFIYQTLQNSIIAHVTSQQWDKVFTNLQTQVTQKSLISSELFNFEGILVVAAVIIILIMFLILIVELV